MDIIAWTWIVRLGLLCVGGSIGSFMNVVIYRWPAGLSITAPASRCPMCMSPIHWFDNVPVLSWFALGGRCRICWRPFSIRYAAIESLVAILFVWIGSIEGLADAANLPHHRADSLGTIEPFGTTSSWLVCAYHLLFLCSLICVIFIQIDGNPIPVRLVLFAICVGMISPLFRHHLLPVSAFQSMKLWSPDYNWLRGLTNCAMGVVAGGFMVLVAERISRTARVLGLRSHLVSGGLVGCCLGWQAAVPIVILAAVCHLLHRRLSRQLPRLPTLPWTFYLVPLSVIWIFSWNLIGNAFPMFV